MHTRRTNPRIKVIALIAAPLISLSLILDALRMAFPEFQRKFNKEFTTGDGITTYRLEVCDAQGNAAEPEVVERIRRTLGQAAASKKVERARFVTICNAHTLARLQEIAGERHAAKLHHLSHGVDLERFPLRTPPRERQGSTLKLVFV